MTAVSKLSDAGGQGDWGDELVALPPAPKSLAGSSVFAGKDFRIVVSNKAGYLCHIHIQACWKDVAPDLPFAILTHPDNSGLLRDMKRVGARKLLRCEPGLRELQVHNFTKVRQLWAHRMYGTWLRVIEDARDPECLSSAFDLIKSEFFLKFSGRWELRPVRDPATGHVVGCRGELTQDVLPKGVPRFLTRMPLVGSALRNVSLRAVRRLMEDLNAAVGKVLAGRADGKSTEEVLQELCGPGPGPGAARAPQSDALGALDCIRGGKGGGGGSSSTAGRPAPKHVPTTEEPNAGASSSAPCGGRGGGGEADSRGRGADHLACNGLN